MPTSNFTIEIVGLLLDAIDLSHLEALPVRAAYPRRCSANANGLCGHVLPKPMGIITISQIHGSFADSRVRVLSPQPRSPVSVGVMSGLQNCARQRGTLAPAFDTLVQYPSNGSNGSASRARAEDYRRRAQECLDVTRTLSLYDARATLIDMAFG